MPEAKTREEIYLSVLSGNKVKLPEPLTITERYLAYLCGVNVDLPQPVTREHMFLAVAAKIKGVDLPVPKTRKELFLNRVVERSLKPKAYTISYYNYDGSELLYSESVNSGEDGAGYEGETPTKEATAQYTYSFVGWNLTAESNEADEDAIKNITADRNVYAAFEAVGKTFTVTFYNGTELVYTAGNVAYNGTAVFGGAEPTKPDTTQYTYTFAGWNSDSSAASADADALKNVTADREVYAIFTQVEKTFTVTFYNGDTVVDTVSNIAYNGTATYGGETPTKASTAQYDYTFAGWTKTQGSTTVDADALTGVTADRNVYAVFTATAKSYTVTFMNVSTLMDTQTVTYGGTAVYGGTTPTKAETSEYTYTFAGWNTNSSASTADADALTNVTADRTVYAIFTAVSKGYTVYFYNGETLLETVTGVPSGGTATYTGSTPTKSGHTFTGWSPSNTNITADTACYAQFAEDEMYESITDTWSQIIANIGNGTYSTRYQVGDTKKIDLGTEGEAIMTIVGIDTDDLADNSGKAPITWISKQLLKTDHRMNPSKQSGTSGTGAIGGWEACEMRSYLINTIKPLLPSEVRNALKTVKKYSKIYNTSETAVNNVVSNDDIWIPSAYEVNFTGYETSGVTYSTAFPDNASRIKRKVGGTAAWWWLRSASTTGIFGVVYRDGSGNYASAYGSGGVAVGFCLGAPLPTYTVTFYNGDTLLETVQNVQQGGTATYTGATPTKSGYVFAGWSPSPTNIQADTACYAQFALEGEIIDDWATISARSAAGTAQNYYSVGDCKQVHLEGTIGTTLNLNTDLYVYILGFNHNATLEGNGITFGGFKTAVKGTDVALCDVGYGLYNIDGTKTFNMNHFQGSSSNGHNYGGWKGCDMRYDILGSTDTAPSGYGAQATISNVGYDASSTCATNPVANTLMSCLPSALRIVMKPITKYTDNKGNSSNTSGNVTASIDYLPLLAEYEIFGKRYYANQYEQNKQAQYAYYADGNNSKVKYKHNSTGSTANWWERSTYCYDECRFCIVDISGKASYTSSRYSDGVAPIFLV